MLPKQGQPHHKNKGGLYQPFRPLTNNWMALISDFVILFRKNSSSLYLWKDKDRGATTLFDLFIISSLSTRARFGNLHKIGGSALCQLTLLQYISPPPIIGQTIARGGKNGSLVYPQDFGNVWMGPYNPALTPPSSPETSFHTKRSFDSHCSSPDCCHIPSKQF